MNLKNLWGMLLVSLVTAGCERPTLVHQSTFGAPDGTLVAITFGVRDPHVDYIVFERGYKYLTNKVLGTLQSRSDGTAIGPLYVQTADQKLLRLEGSRKVFELSDQGMKFSGIALTKVEFERFLKLSRTNLADLSIDGLNKWLPAVETD